MQAQPYILTEPSAFGGAKSAAIDGNLMSALAIPLTIMFGAAILVVFGRSLVTVVANLLGDGSPVNVSKYKMGINTVVVAFIVIVALIPFATYINGSFKNAELRKIGELTATGPAAASGAPSSGLSTLNTSENMALILQTEEINRARLLDFAITVNKRPCQGEEDDECTNVGGMSERTLSMLMTLKRDCRCAIQVTGGTEGWLHSQTTKHTPSGGAVDISLNANGVNKYIKDTFGVIPFGSGCSEKYSGLGFTFCNETIAGNAPHWHIQPN